MNCPKCGNPLQPGVKSCQICGTNIEETNGGPAPAPAATPTAAPAEKVSVPVQATQPEAAPATTVAPTSIAPTPEPVAAPTEQPAAPTAPAPTEQPAAPAAPTPNVVTVENVATPAAPVTAPAETTTPAPAEANTIAPVVSASTSNPIPSIPASIGSTTVQAPEVASLKEEKPKKKKTSLAIIVIALVVVLGGMGIYMFTSGGMNLGGSKASKNLTTDIAKGTEVSSNGYKFQLKEGWVMDEDNNNNVVISNTDETVAIKLDHNNSGISTIKKEMIKAYLDLYPDYTDTNINETQIGAKNAFLVNANLNQLPIQIYFIDGGNNLTLGATIVYQSNESKTKNESVVTEIVGSVSYTETSYKALDTITKYSEAFSAFNGVFKNNNEKPATPAPTENTPVENPGVESETQTTEPTTPEENTTPTEESSTQENQQQQTE